MIKLLVHVYDWLKGRLPSVVFHSGMVLGFSVAGMVINFITNLLILPKLLDEADLGLVAPVAQFVAIGNIPLAVVGNLITKFIVKYEANNEWGKLKRLIRDLIIFGSVSTLIIAAVFVISYEGFFAIRVGINSRWILFWMLFHLIISSWRPLVGVLARSIQQFFVFGLSAFLTPIILLLCVIGLLPTYGFTGYLVALVVSSAISLIIAVYSIYNYFKLHSESPEPYFNDCKDVLSKYLLILGVAAGIAWLWNFIPPFAVKHFLSNKDAGGYYFVARLAQLPFYAVSSLMLVLLPIMSMQHEKKISDDRIFKWSVIYTLASGAFIVISLYLASPLLFELIPQWRKYSEYSPYVWLMSINVILTSLTSVISTALIAKWNFGYMRYSLPVSLFFCLLIYTLLGWGGLRGYFPYSFWNYINVNVSRGLSSLIILMISCNMSLLLVLLFCYRKQKRDDGLF